MPRFARVDASSRARRRHAARWMTMAGGLIASLPALAQTAPPAPAAPASAPAREIGRAHV